MKLKQMIGCITIAAALLVQTCASAATVKDLLVHGTEPVGKCLYVYGGGWNEEDTGAGAEAMSYGVPERWEQFYNQNDSSYDFNNTRYQIHDGLDCTGYVGWLMYQLFGDTYSDTGYVFPSKLTSPKYAEIFGGTYIPKEELTVHQCGDIMSTAGHAYVVLGECGDGSIVILNMSPPAVSICGTYTPDGRSDSEAVTLAEKYMRKYFPECIEKYPNYSRNSAYLTDYNAMRWNAEILSDPDNYRNMKADEILEDLFEKIKIYANGGRVVSDTDAYIANDQTYVPIRAAAEKLGANVTWDNSANSADIKLGAVDMKINPDQNTVYVNGAPVPSDVQMVNDRICVTAQFIADNFGIKSSWDEKSKSLYFTAE